MSKDNEREDSPLDTSLQLSGLNLGPGAEKGSDLLKRCRVLLDELELFQQYLAEEKREPVELRQFKNSVKTECKLLEKVPLYDFKCGLNTSDSCPALEL